MTPPPDPIAGLPGHPALAPWCRLVQDDGRVLLEHAGTLVTLEGAAVRTLLPRLLPLLDGTRTQDDLVATLGPAIAPAVEQALALLAENGLLVDGPVVDDAAPLTHAATYAAALLGTTTQAACIAALDRARIAVVGSGATASEVVRQLRSTGVGQVDALSPGTEPPSGAFVVAAPEPAELDALLRVNERALGCGDPWLQVLPYDGRHVVAGPVFLPGTSGCRACFVTRRAAASGFDDDFDTVERAPRRTPAPAPLVSIGAALATMLVVRWLAAADPTLPGRFYALDAGVVVRLRFDRLLRVPRCRACGTHTRAVPSPWFEAVA